MEKVDLLAAINLLVDQMDQKPDDLHEVHFKLRELIGQFRATGMPLPDDLVELDRLLEANDESVPPEASN